MVPKVLASSNLGLKLANAFGVLQIESIIKQLVLKYAEGVGQCQPRVGACDNPGIDQITSKTLKGFVLGEPFQG